MAAAAAVSPAEGHDLKIGSTEPNYPVVHVASTRPSPAFHPVQTPCGGEVRGRYLQLLLERVARLPAEDAYAIKRAAGPELLADILKTSALGWVPIEHELVMARAVSLRLGARRTGDFYLALGTAACECPPLESHVQAARKSARGNVVHVLGAIPSAKELVVRGAGRWALSHHTAATAILTVADVPELLAREALWTQAMASELASWLAVSGVRGSVTVHEASVLRRVVAFRFRWRDGLRPSVSGGGT